MAGGTHKTSAIVGVVLGLAMGGMDTVVLQRGSDYDQVVGWAILLGLVVALPFFIYSLGAWLVDKARHQRERQP